MRLLVGFIGEALKTQAIKVRRSLNFSDTTLMVLYRPLVPSDLMMGRSQPLADTINCDVRGKIERTHRRKFTLPVQR